MGISRFDTSVVIIGILQDYPKIIVNMRQKLIRSSNDKDAVIRTDDSEEPSIDIITLTWCVPHVVPSLQE